MRTWGALMSADLSPPPDEARTANSAVEIITLGCRLNAYESEAIGARAQEAGLSDAVIINTCAVTQEAVRQARQAIRRARRERPDARIIVTGCAVQIDPTSFAAMPEADLVLGNVEKLQAHSYAPAALAAPERVRVADIMAVRETAPHMIDGFKARTRVYLEVQNGCDHRCTFCVIPFGRGNARSAPAGAVVEQVARVVAAGAPEVVLTGVDLTSWGADLPGAPALGNLVARILKLVPDLPMLRLSSIDAVEMDDVLFDLVTTHPRVAPYLHLSLQHGHDLILKRMRRRHSTADALALIARLKAARSEIALGADLIAGFPTEAEEHFTAMLDFVDQAQLSFVHVFPYSPRDGTPAARMPQTSRAEIKARAARLRGKAGERLQVHLHSHVGQTRSALIEQPGAGRLDDFTPLRVDSDAVGTRIDVMITGQDGARLIGAPLTSA
jgi:threonylcarbamoyladenosine tRNA methylthiotransferase MtaB